MVEDEGGNMKALDKNQAFEIDENIKKMEAKRLRIIEKVIEYNKSVEEYEGNIKPKLIGNRDIFKNNY
jgi:hypothetical protein